MEVREGEIGRKDGMDERREGVREGWGRERAIQGKDKP